MTTSPIRQHNDPLDHRTAPPADKFSATNHPVGQISDVFDFLKHESGPCLSIEQLNQLIATSWAGER